MSLNKFSVLLKNMDPAKIPSKWDLFRKPRPSTQGLGKNGPQYNPGQYRQFTPGPMPDIPFMPAAQLGPQQIALGGAPQPGDPGPVPPPNMDPGPVLPNLGMTGGLTPKTANSAGIVEGEFKTAPKPAFDLARLQSLLALLGQGGGQQPQGMPWLPSMAGRWGA